MPRRTTRRELAAAPLAALALALPAAPAYAEPELAPIGSFSSPTYLTGPRGDSRLFVVERAGTIRVLRDGRSSGRSFLDIRSAVTTRDAEQGMLSLAFPLDYIRSGRFYVSFTDGDGRIVIAEYQRSEDDPDIADPGSRRDVLVIPHPTYGNHNGGQLQFGPDGYLYVATGDGGGSGDPTNNAQSLVSGLGKILRFDPRRPTSDGSGGGLPPDNPFAGQAGYAPLVWSTGLRNPHRFSFDAASGDLTIGDAGETRADEIDFVANAAGRGRGANFGWRCFEGTERTPASGALGAPPLCDDGQAAATRGVGPAISIPRAAGGCSIVGGYVVRDSTLPSLAGRYLYGDACSPALASVALGRDQPRPEPLRTDRLISFGQDACQRVYAISARGTIWRVQERGRTFTPCGFPAAPDEGGSGTSRAAGPRVSVRFGSTRGLLRSGSRMNMRVRCDRACKLRASTSAFGRRSYTSHCTLRSSRHSLTLPLKLTSRQRSSLRRKLRRSRSTVVKVRFVTTDRSTKKRRTTYKRLRIKR